MATHSSVLAWRIPGTGEPGGLPSMGSHRVEHDWSKEIQPVHSEEDQPWDFFGRNDAKAETPVLWPPHAKRWLIGKDSDAGRDRGQEEKGMTEDEMAGWHHWFDGRKSEWTPGVGDGQGGMACCSSWGHKESDTTEQLNWTELNWVTNDVDHLLLYSDFGFMVIYIYIYLLLNLKIVIQIFFPFLIELSFLLLSCNSLVY